MKEYKKQNNYFKTKSLYKYDIKTNKIFSFSFIIKNKYHGLLYYNGYNYYSKGFYNMDIKYSHWVRFDNVFYYYL